MANCCSRCGHYNFTDKPCTCKVVGQYWLDDEDIKEPGTKFWSLGVMQDDHSDAVEEIGERLNDESAGEMFDSSSQQIDIHYQCINADGIPVGPISAWTITREWEPTFSASKTEG